VVRRCGVPLRRAVTATTRDPRPGERPEFDYHFWDRTRFQREIDSGGMLEWAIVHGDQYYGTPRTEVDPIRSAGTGVLLIVDVQGVAAVREAYPGDHFSIFLLPPSLAELEHRLTVRGETTERIQRRMISARGEIARAGEYDRIVVNAEFDATVSVLSALIRREFTTGSNGNAG
jgi:guanylate kinase